MLNAVLRLFLALTCCTLSGVASAEHRTNTPLHVCVDQEDLFPWIIVDSRTHVVSSEGLSTALLQRTAALLGLTVETQAVPWKRCLSAVKAGEMDAAYVATYTEERAQFAAYPMSEGKPDENLAMVFATSSFYRRKDSRVSWDGRELRGLTGSVGVQQGYLMAATLRAKGIEVDDGAKGVAENLGKLALGRLGAVALSTADGDRVLEQTPELNAIIERVKPPIEMAPMYLIFSKTYTSQHPGQAERIWRALAATRQSAWYKEISGSR